MLLLFFRCLTDSYNHHHQCRPNTTYPLHFSTRIQLAQHFYVKLANPLRPSASEDYLFPTQREWFPVLQTACCGERAWEESEASEQGFCPFSQIFTCERGWTRLLPCTDFLQVHILFGRRISSKYLCSLPLSPSPSPAVSVFVHLLPVKLGRLCDAEVKLKNLYSSDFELRNLYHKKWSHTQLHCVKRGAFGAYWTCRRMDDVLRAHHDLLHTDSLWSRELYLALALIWEMSRTIQMEFGSRSWTNPLTEGRITPVPSKAVLARLLYML